MKQLQTLICATVFVLISTAASNSFAGTVTPSGQPSFSPSNVFSNNSIVLQQSSGSAVKLLGNTKITPGAGASTVSIILTGNFSANQNDFASYYYNFNIALNSATPATFNLTVTANPTSPVSLGPLTATTGTQAITANSNQNYTGSGVTASNPLPFAESGNFTATLAFTFGAGTLAGDTLTLTIPSNSIDFAVQATAIPEPSTYVLFGLGLVGLVIVSRRRLATR